MIQRHRDSGPYLADMLCAIERIGEYTKEGRDAFFKNGLVQDAVIRQLSILGEAAARLPSTVRAKYGDVPWKQIIGMRNIIVHDYADTDLGTVWDTVEKDLPGLRRRLLALARRAA